MENKSGYLQNEQMPRIQEKKGDINKERMESEDALLTNGGQQNNKNMHDK